MVSLTGIGAGKLDTGMLQAMELLLPPRHTQEAIVAIGKTIDDKIDLYRRMNETLEALGREFFRSWFMDFGPIKSKMGGRQPTGMDTQTAKLFPGRLVESELGQIPEGWHIGPLKGIAKLKTNAVNPGHLPNNMWEHYSIPAYDEGRRPRHELGETIKSNKYSVPIDSVLVSKLNPQFPRIWLTNVVSPTRAICSTEFMPFSPNTPLLRSFLYELMKSDRIQNEIINNATGSTGSRQRVKPTDITQLKIVTPPQDILNAFNHKVAQIHDKISLNIASKDTLTHLRNAILPKILSGDLSVAEVEKRLGGD